MSGTSTEPPSWTAATDAELQSGAVTLTGVIVPGVQGNVDSLARTVTAAQIAALVKTGTVTDTQQTTGAVATSFAGLPLMGSTGRGGRISGSVTAYEFSGPGYAEWTFDLPAIQAVNGSAPEVPTTIGGDSPAPAKLYGYGTLSALADPTLGANSTSLLVSASGLSGLTVVWVLTAFFEEVAAP